MVFADLVIYDENSVVLVEEKGTVYPYDTSAHIKKLQILSAQGFKVCGRVTLDGEVGYITTNPSRIVSTPYWFGRAGAGAPLRHDPLNPGGNVCVYVSATDLMKVLHVGGGSASAGLLEILESHGERAVNAEGYTTCLDKGRNVSLYLSSPNMKKAKGLGGGVASKGVRVAMKAYTEPRIY